MEGYRPTALQRPFLFIICRRNKRLVNQLNGHLTTKYTANVSNTTISTRMVTEELTTTTQQGHPTLE